MAPSADWDSFSLWLEGNKIDLPGTGLSIGKVAEGHGLVATRNIAEGDKILSIPTTVMMSTKGARSALAKLIEADKTFMNIGAVQMTMFIIHELHKEYTDSPSFFIPYLRTLPKTLTLPIFWSVDEIKRLAPSTVLEDTIKTMVTAALQYSFIHALLQNVRDSGIRRARFTFDQFLWAQGIVFSRQNMVPIDERMELALIPAWDLMNHVDGEITSFYDPATKSLQCKCLRAVSTGEQVYMSYGGRPNCELLLYQGFIDPANSNDVLDLPNQECQEGDFAREEKNAFLASNLTYVGFNVIDTMYDLLKEEWKAMDKSAWPHIPEGSSRSELEVCARIIALASNHLARYSEEEAIPPSSGRFHTIQQLHECEKKILRKVIETTEAAQKRLQSNVKKADKRKAKRKAAKAKAKAAKAETGERAATEEPKADQ